MTIHDDAGPAIGLIGCGGWGRHILRDLRALGCRVIVADPSEAARAGAIAGGAEAAVGDGADLPGGLHGLVVATPTGTHQAVIEGLLPYGAPLFVEKPLTADPVTARDLARRAAGRLFVMDKWRYHPGIEALAAIVRSGELGPIRRLSTQRLGWGERASDVDAVWALLPHDLAIVLEILGEIPEPSAAVADVIDGRFVGLAGGLGRAPQVFVEVSDRHPVSRRQVVVDCRDGVAQLADAGAGHLVIRRPAGGLERRPIGTALPLARELAAFIAYLGGGPPPRSSAAEGAAIVETLATLRRIATR
jgi:predicted dehydrogenase